jgi:hypothetical protein
MGIKEGKSSVTEMQLNVRIAGGRQLFLLIEQVHGKHESEDNLDPAWQALANA